MRPRRMLVAAALVLGFRAGGERVVHACSTFVLARPGVMLYGHNLDGESVVAGRVYVNPRGVLKRGHTLSELTTPGGKVPSRLSWVSRFGSVTFNNLGLDFPDGGMNEAGLFVWEMTLQGTRFAADDRPPDLFMMQWMQHVLDTCSRVEEVVASAQRVVLDGWSWHFLVADGRGGRAAIAFVDGRPVIHEGNAMPVPLLCNAPYAEELERLSFYQGFGGAYARSLDDPSVPRFVKAAKRMAELEGAAEWRGGPVAVGLELLRILWGGAPSQWSVLCDPVRGELHFFSDVAPEVKSFSIRPDWLAAGQPVRWLDLHRKEGGDVGDLFHELTAAENRAHHAATLSRWWQPGQTPPGWVGLDLLIDRFAEASLSPDPGPLGPLLGRWRGTATIADGEPFRASETWQLDLSLDRRALAGRLIVGDGTVEMEPVQHLRLSDAGLSFTFRPAEPVAEGYPKGYPLVSVDLRLDGDALAGGFRLARNAIGTPGTVRMLRTP